MFWYKVYSDSQITSLYQYIIKEFMHSRNHAFTLHHYIITSLKNSCIHAIMHLFIVYKVESFNI